MSDVKSWPSARVQVWLAQGNNQQEWDRLREALELADGFTFLAVSTENEAAERIVGELLAERAASENIAVRGFDLGVASPDRLVVTRVLDEIAAAPRRRWFYFWGGPQARLHELDLGRAFLLLNQKREVISRDADAPFILALHPHDWILFRRNAPDFWSIYHAIFRFAPAQAPDVDLASKVGPETASRVALPTAPSTPSGWRMALGERPSTIKKFVGRLRERRHLSASLREAGARIMVTGQGGIGKTALVRVVVEEVFERYTDGIWWVPLEELTGSPRERVNTALGRVLGDLLPQTQMPPEIDQRAHLFRVVTNGRLMLFVFDDVDDGSLFEFLIPGQVASVVVTSRIRGQASEAGFVELGVDGLSPDDLRALVKGWAPNVSDALLPTLESTSRGSPLVAGLLGAYARQSLSPWELVSLGDADDMIATVVDRTLTRSSADASTLWPVLGVFEGLFTTEDVVTVSEMKPTVAIEALHELVGVGLLRRELGDQFGLPHLLLREAALALLKRRPDATNVSERYLQLAVAQGRVNPPGFAELVADLLARYRSSSSTSSQRDELLSAIQRVLTSSDSQLSADLAKSLADAAARHGDDETERTALRSLTSALFRLGRYGEAVDSAWRWTELAKRDAPQEVASAYIAASHAARFLNRLQEAAEFATRAYTHAAERGDTDSQALAMIESAQSWAALRQYDRAARDGDEAVRLAQTSGNRSLQVWALLTSAEIATESGRLEEAIERWSEAVRAAAEIGDVYSEGQAKYGRAGALRQTRRLSEAHADYARALELAKVGGDRVAVARISTSLGWLERELGNMRAAAEHFRRAVADYDALASHSRGLQAALLGSSIAMNELGDDDAALQLAQRLLSEEDPDSAGASMARSLIASILLRNSPKKAAEQIQRIVDAFNKDSSSERARHTEAMLWAAELLLKGGIPDDAIDVLRVLIHGLRGNTLLANERVRAHGLLSVGLLMQGHPEEAERHIDDTRSEFASEYDDEYADRIAGMLRKALNDSRS